MLLLELEFIKDARFVWAYAQFGLPFLSFFSSTLHPHWSSFSVVFCLRSFKRKYHAGLFKVNLFGGASVILRSRTHRSSFPVAIPPEPSRAVVSFLSRFPRAYAHAGNVSFFLKLFPQLTRLQVSFLFTFYRAHRADLVSLFQVAVRCFRSAWDSVSSFVVF